MAISKKVINHPQTGFNERIEYELNQISQLIAVLKKDDLSKLSSQLQCIRNEVGQLEYYIDNLLRKKKEAEIRQAVKEFAERFENFKQINIDGFHFTRESSGKLKEVNDEIPF